MKPCFSSLLTKLNGIPCDLEAQRVFLIIPEILAYDEKEERVKFIASFGEKILDMKDEARKMLCKLVIYSLICFILYFIRLFVYTTIYYSFND